MRQLTLLLSLLLVIGCSSSTDPNQGEDPAESPYPIRYGTWEMQSRELGLWQGKSKAKFLNPYIQSKDSIVVIDTLNYSLTLTKDDNSAKLVVEFRDGLTMDFFSGSFEITKPPAPFIYEHATPFGNKFQPNIRYYLYQDCVYDEYPPMDTLEVFIKPENQDSVFYQFAVEGFADAVNHIVCPN